ncbi:hypothetical protein ASG81_24360 [Paenibacillus sp. Soil522]|nr:hypothetical protein ASG81_24360 [Paenibacillus sp. Soil522]
MKASKLMPGDEIRIIAPSRSLSLIAADQIEIAKRKLEHLGFIVSSSKNLPLLHLIRNDCAAITYSSTCFSDIIQGNVCS